MRDYALQASRARNAVDGKSIETLAEEITQQLEARFGPLLAGDALFRALGFPTAGAFRQAVARGQVHVPLFEIPNRRGRFALTREVALWLAHCRAASSSAQGNQSVATDGNTEDTM